MRRHAVAVFLIIVAFHSYTALPANPTSGLIVNGDFETGDLTGWTPFTTAFGDIGASAGFPMVISFDTDGDGSDSLAVAFRVGRETIDVPTREGGGIFQSVSLEAGTYTISADIATLGSSLGNADGGLFELLFDSVVVDAHDFGSVPAGVSEHSMLAAITVADAGLHEVRFRMTRDYLQGGPYGTPVQYIDNVVLIPEPTTIALFGLGSLALAMAGRRR